MTLIRVVAESAQTELSGDDMKKTVLFSHPAPPQSASANCGVIRALSTYKVATDCGNLALKNESG